MKILFIHLSDIHFKYDLTTDYCNIIETVNVYKGVADKCFIVFSGDMSYSGSKNEIVYFDSFITLLVSGIQNNLGIETNLLIVPGNHDIEINLNTQIKPDSLSLMKQKEKEDAYVKELTKQINSLDFCESKGFDFHKRSISNVRYDFGRYCVNVNLINSAPFSTLNSNNLDKGIHCLFPFDSTIVGDETLGKKTIEVLISHHRPDWFEYNSQQAISQFEEKVASICFYGHEHEGKTISETIDGNTTIISKGGCLSVSGTKIVGSFIVILVDCEREECEKAVFSTQRNSSSFKLLSRDRFNIRMNDRYAIKTSFISEIINPTLVDDIREKDLFVMNFLQANGEQNDICDFDKLVGFIDKNKKCFIHGTSRAGKSFLLHRLFEQYSLTCETCIYYDCEERTSKNIEQNIKNVFEDEYERSDMLYEQFKNNNNQKRVLIVDNFDAKDQSFKKRSIYQFCF